MAANKSRHKKFRGRTYLCDLRHFITSDEWLELLSVTENRATDDDAWRRARFKLLHTEVHRIDVDHNCAGMVDYNWNRLDLHTALFEDSDAMRAELKDTLWHEISHLIAKYAAGHAGHGRVWRAIFSDFGFTPTRCHSMPRLRGTTGRQRTRTVYEYICNGCGAVWKRRKKTHCPELFKHRKCPGDREKGYRFHRSYKEPI